MWTVRGTRVPRVLATLLVAALVVLAVACGGSSGTTTSTSTSAPSTTTETSTATSAASTTASSVLSGEAATIAANWLKFFDGKVAPQKKIGLLESGQQYMKELDANAASPFAKSSTATVSTVTITSPTTATVKYSILVGGQPALPDQTGQAVKQGGVWKVGAQSFLALLALQGGSSTSTPTTGP